VVFPLTGSTLADIGTLCFFLIKRSDCGVQWNGTVLWVSSTAANSQGTTAFATLNATAVFRTYLFKLDICEIIISSVTEMYRNESIGS
jgi:hypothetical protein